ncbi:MAG: triose-phosphate isomerase, partial [Alphaproteobacteria bacterium]
DYADARQQRIAALAASLLGRAVPVLYGGSVHAGNCAELIACPHVDGLFIGRAAWEAEGYLDILQRVAAAIPRPGPRSSKQRTSP